MIPKDLFIEQKIKGNCYITINDNLMTENNDSQKLGRNK